MSLDTEAVREPQHTFGPTEPLSTQAGIISDRKDPVLQAMEKHIRGMTKKSIRDFVLNIRVRRAESFEGSSDAEYPATGAKLYTFLMRGEKTAYNPRTVPIRAEVAGISAEVNLDQVLVGTPDITGRLRDLRGLATQQKWWNTNGMQFQLLDLPQELRASIFMFAMGPIIHPYTATAHPAEADLNKEVVTFANLHQPGLYGFPHNYRNPNRNLLLVSKQVREEALAATWLGTLKYFSQPQRFLSVTRSLRTISFNCLGRIILDMDNKHFFDFFGVRVTDSMTLQRVTPVPAAGFALIPQIKFLELHFRNPQDGYDQDPWGYVALNVWQAQLGFSIQHFDTSCAKITDDWILTFAKQYIQHIPTIKITGFIKHSVRRKWEDTFKDERNGQHHDVTGTLQLIMEQKEHELLPPCCCTTSCVMPGNRSQFLAPNPLWPNDTCMDFDLDTFDLED